MNRQSVIAALLALLVQGCASLQYAGVASYSVEPVDIGGVPHCCRVAIHNGKEIARLDARIEKRGTDYTVHLRQWNVDAFRGQQIAADAASATASTAATAAASILMAPAAASLGTAAIGALAR